MEGSVVPALAVVAVVTALLVVPRVVAGALLQVLQLGLHCWSPSLPSVQVSKSQDALLLCSWGKVFEQLLTFLPY